MNRNNDTEILRRMMLRAATGENSNISLTLREKIAVTRRRISYLEKKIRNPDNPKDLFWTIAELETLKTAVVALQLVD